VNWIELATNNSIKSTPNSANAELPAYVTASGGIYKGDRVNQRVQELFDPAGVPIVPPRYVTNDFDQPAPTTALQWRQARVDLGDLAGKSNIRLRFDFSTAATMGIGTSGQGGVYLGAVAGAKLQDLQAFSIDGVQFTFRQGLAIKTPNGGGAAIVE